MPGNRGNLVQQVGTAWYQMVISKGKLEGPVQSNNWRCSTRTRTRTRTTTKKKHDDEDDDDNHNNNHDHDNLEVHHFTHNWCTIQPTNGSIHRGQSSTDEFKYGPWSYIDAEWKAECTSNHQTKECDGNASEPQS